MSESLKTQPSASRKTRRSSMAALPGLISPPVNSVLGLPVEPTRQPQNAAAHDWLKRLLKFGFAGVTVEWLRELTLPQQLALQDLLTSWETEFAAATEGRTDRYPTPVPSFLKTFDAATPEQSQIATQLGTAAKSAGFRKAANPYPPGTALNAIWKEAYHAAPSRLSSKPSTSEREALDSADLLRAKSHPARRSGAPDSPISQNKESREVRRHDYINWLQTSIEELVERAREFHSQMKRLDNDAQQARTNWSNAISQAEDASEKLQLARAGIFPESSWSRPHAAVTTDLTVFDSPAQDAAPSVQEEIESVHKKPLPDEGARFDLNCLQRGKLQNLTHCDPDWGLSPRQIERLKDSVSGHTIGHLEKFQRETCNWEQAIRGFGESAITKLQDAHLAFRMKYDMPQLDDFALVSSEPKASSSIHNQADDSGLATVDFELERLDQILNRCEELIESDQSDDQQTTEFCNTVIAQASHLRQKLEENQQVQAEQRRTINNWTIALENYGK